MSVFERFEQDSETADLRIAHELLRSSNDQI